MYQQKHETDYGIKVVLIFWVVSYFFWIITSGNGRYGLPLFMLSGVIVAHSLFRVLGDRRGLFYLVVLCGLQLSVLVTSADFRWNSTKWGSSYIGYEIPENLKLEPYLYVSTTKQSNSFLAPFVHPDSAFINISGQLPLRTEKSLETLFDKAKASNGRVRIVARLKYKKDFKTFSGWSNSHQGVLSKFGWNLKEDNCNYLPHLQNDEFKYDLIYLAFCDLGHDSSLANDFQTEKIKADNVFDLVESHCPEHFNPSTGVTERSGSGLSLIHI